MAGGLFILPPDLSKGNASVLPVEANPLPTGTDRPNGDMINPGTQNEIPNDFNHVLGALWKPAQENSLNTYVTPYEQTRKYPNFNPLVDNEELYAAEQSGWSQLSHGLAKGGIFAATTFLESWLSIPDMIRGIGGGNLYKNEWAQAFDDFRENSENWLPNYYSHWEQEHPFYSMIPFSKGFGNFLGDKFFKNFGFTIGAIGGAVTQDALIGALTGGTGVAPLLAAQVGRASLWLNKIMSSTRNIRPLLEAARELKASKSAVTSLEQLYAAKEGVRLGNKARHALTLASATHTEAAIEAREGYNSLKQELVNQYKQEHGYEPNGPDAVEIEKIATAAGNTRYGLNAAILGISNTIQFNTLLKTFNSTKSALKSGLDVGGTKITVADAATVAGIDKLATVPTKGIWNKIKPAIPNILSEGVWEEGTQFAVERGTNMYFKDKYNGKHKGELNDILNYTMRGLDEQFTSSEGWESMILGALTGLVFSPISSKVSDVFQKYQSGQTKEQRIQSLVNNLNAYGVTGIFQDNYDNAADSIKRQEDIRAAIENDDIFKYKNVKASALYDFFMSAIKAGRLDVRIEQLNLLKELSDEELQKYFGTDRQNAVAYVDKLIAKGKELEQVHNATPANPYNFNTKAKTEDELVENAAYLQFEQYRSALSYYTFKGKDLQDRIHSIQSAVTDIDPNIDANVVSNITAPVYLRDTALEYEREAASLENSLENISPELKRQSIKRITTLKTLSNRIKKFLDSPEFNESEYLTLFNELLPFETSGRTSTSPTHNPKDTPNLIQYGVDLSKIRLEMDGARHALESLVTEQGFNDFMDEYVNWRNNLENPVVPDLPEVEGTPTGSQFKLEKVPLYSVRKNPDSTYSVIDPITGKAVSIHGNRSNASKEAFARNEQRAKLSSFTLEGMNENGTVRVVDSTGNVQDIPEQFLDASEKVKTQLDVVNENPDIKTNIVEDQTKQSETTSPIPTGDPTREIGELAVFTRSRRKAASILFSSTTAPSDVTETEQNTRVRNEQVFFNTINQSPARPYIKAVMVTRNTESSIGLRGITNYVMRRNVNDPTQYSEDTNPSTGAISLVYIDTRTNKIVDINGNPIRDLNADTPINYDTIPVSVLPTAELTWSGGQFANQPRYRAEKAGEKEAAEAYSQAWENQRKELFEQETFQYRPFEFAISRGLAVRDIVEDVDDNGVKTKRHIYHPVTDTIVPKEALDTPGLVQVSTGTILLETGDREKVPAGRPMIVYKDTYEYLTNRKLSREEAFNIYQVLLQASKDALKDRGIIPAVYYKYLQGILFFYNKNLGKDANLSGRNRVYIDNNYNLSIANDLIKIPFTPEEIERSREQIVRTLQEVYNNVDALKLKDNKPFTEIIGISNGKPALRVWKSYQHYLLSPTYELISGPNNGKKRTDLPLAVDVAPITKDRPYNYIQKYAILSGLEVKPERQLPEQKKELSEQKKELPGQKPALPSPVPTSGTHTVYIGKTSRIPVTFTMEDGRPQYDDEALTQIIGISELPTVQAAASQQGKDPMNLAFEIVTNEIARYFAPQAAAEPAQEAPQQETPAQEDTPIIGTEDSAKTPKAKKSLRVGRGNNSQHSLVETPYDERMTPEDWRIFEEWKAKNLPNFSHEELSGLVRLNRTQSAWGVMEDKIAKIYRYAKKGTEYHETFEQVWGHILSPEEQAALIEEFRATPRSWYDRYSKSNVTNQTASDASIKERLADDFAEYIQSKNKPKGLVKRFFDLIRKIFQKFVHNLGLGKKQSLSQELFEKLNTGQYREAMPNEDILDPQYSVIDGWDQESSRLLVQDVFVDLMYQMFADPNKSIFNISSLTDEQLFENVRRLYVENGIYEELGQDGWNQLVQMTKDYLRTFKVVLEESSINEESTDRNEYTQQPFTVDAKSSSPWPLKLLIAGLPRTEYDPSSVGQIPQALYAKTSIDGFEAVNFAKTFVTLLDRLSGTPNWDAQFEQLKNLAKENSDFVKLFTRLRGMQSTGTIDYQSLRPDDWRLLVTFFNTFSKQKPVPDTLLISDDVYLLPASASRAAIKLKDEWINDIRGMAGPNGLIQPQKDGSYKILAYDKPLDKAVDNVKYINKLGVIFPREIHQKLSGPDKIKFTSLVGEIHKELSGKTISSITSRTLNITGYLTQLASLYVKVAGVELSSTYIGPGGKQRALYGNKNYISQFADDFNSVNTLDELLERRPELNDVFSRNSVILRRGGMYFNTDGERRGPKLEVHTLLAVKDERADKETALDRLTEQDRYLLEFLANLNGIYYTLLPADSSTEWAYNIGNQIDYDYYGQTDRIHNRFNTIMKNYLKDEIDLALEDRSHIKNIGHKAKHLRFFREILSPSTIEAIEALIKDNKTDEAHAYVERNKADINAQLRDYLKQYAGRTLRSLTQHKLLLQYNENSYSFPTLPSTFYNKKDVGLYGTDMNEKNVQDLLLFHSVNYIINNTEYHKLIFGDPYTFTAKSKNGKLVLDETKRIKSYESPRSTTFDHPEFNQWHNDHMNKVGDIQLTSNDPGYHVFRPYFNTLTLKDVEIVSKISTLNSTPEHLRQEYARVNEADASAWRTLASYRDVNMREGTWDYDYAEKWYQYEMAYTRQKLSKSGKYAYQSKELERHDSNLLKGPRPRHTIEVRKPITTGSKYGVPFIDNVLDKTSELPIYYSMVEGTAMEDVFIQMFQKDIQLLIVESGRKQGAEELAPLYNPDGTLSDLPNTPISISWAAYGKQVENAHSDKKQPEGSQVTKIATMDLISNGVPIDYQGDNWDQLTEEEKLKSPIYKLVKDHDTVLSAMKEDGYNNLIKKLGLVEQDGTFYVQDAKKLQEVLLNEMKRREMSDNAYESLQWNSETNTFAIPFEASTHYNQIRNILYSLVDKVITSPKHNGGPKVQVAATMWESAKDGRELIYRQKKNDRFVYRTITRDQYNELSDENKKNVFLSSSNLHFYTKEKPYMEVYLPMWFRDKLKRHPRWKNASDEEVMQYLNESDDGQAILSGIGFRIPTQALSSIESIKVKGFLHPDMGNTIVVPSEITTKAGSDFDIDKLNTYLKNVYLDTNGDIKEVPYFGIGQSAKEKLKEVLLRYHDTSDLLLDLVAIGDVKAVDALDTLDIDALERDEERDLQTLYTQSLENEYYNILIDLLSLPQNYERLLNPNSTMDLIPISEEIDRLTGYDESNIRTRMLDFNYLNNLRHMFITAKRWVGIGAVNITGHALAQREPIILDLDRLPVPIPYLADDIINLPHNSIVRDGRMYPTLSAIHSTDDRYISDTLSALINSFVDVAKDPFIMKIIRSDKVVGIFTTMIRLGVPLDYLSYFMNQPIIVDYLRLLDIHKSTSVINRNLIDTIINNYGGVSSRPSYDLDTLKENIRIAAAKKLPPGFQTQQVSYFNEFLKYAQLSDALFKFTQATTYDTTSFRSSDTLLKKQLQTEEVLLNNPWSSVGSIFSNSFIGVVAEKLDRADEALSQYLILNQSPVSEVLTSIKMPYITRQFLSNDDLQRISNKLNNTILAYGISRAHNLKASSLVGQNSLPKQIIRELSQISDNRLIENFEIVASSRQNGPDYIRLKTQPTTAYEQNLYTELLRELRENPDTLLTYRKLITVAILQGTNYSRYNLLPLFPLEDDNVLGYAGILREALPSVIDPLFLDEFRNQFFFERNNWRDENIVPTYKPNINRAFSNSLGANKLDYMILDPTYSSRYTQYPVLKVRRTQYIDNQFQQGYYDLLTDQELSNSRIAEMRRNGDYSYNDFIGYSKFAELEGKVIYKRTNLLGDGSYVQEFSGTPSFNNGTIPIAHQIADPSVLQSIVPEANRPSSPVSETSYSDYLTVLSQFSKDTPLSQADFDTLTELEKTSLIWNIINCK